MVFRNTLRDRTWKGGKVYALPNFRKRSEKRRKELETKLDTLPVETVRKKLIFTPKNRFIAFLSGLFGEETAKALVEKYRIGTTRDGFTVFYQYDIMGRCRTGKIIPYDPHTGHRIKDGSVRKACGCIAVLKQCISCPMAGRCPSACSASIYSPATLTFPSHWLKPKRLRSSALQSFPNSSGSPPADSPSSTTV